MFASKSVAEHIARGLIGVAALTGAILSTSIWISIALVPVGLVALRGCPLCWTFGLFETLLARAGMRSAARMCADGSCARKG